jgi:hypothetical protein
MLQMLDKIKLKLLVIGAIFAIISLFTIIISWLGVSVWWLLSGYMVSRVTFLYIYLILTVIPLLFLGFMAINKSKNKDK